VERIKQGGYNKIILKTIIKSKIYTDFVENTRGVSQIGKILSKPEEYIADSYAVKYGYGEEERRIETMLFNDAKRSLCFSIPPGYTCEEWVEKFYKGSSHPSGLKRLQFVEKLMSDSRVQNLLKKSAKIGVLKWIRLMGKLLIELYSKKGATKY